MSLLWKGIYFVVLPRRNRNHDRPINRMGEEDVIRGWVDRGGGVDMGWLRGCVDRLCVDKVFFCCNLFYYNMTIPCHDNRSTMK